MSRILRCNDLMPGCNWVGRGESDTDVLLQAAEHAKTAHNITEISPEMLASVQGAIRDEDQAQAQSAGS